MLYFKSSKTFVNWSKHLTGPQAAEESHFELPNGYSCFSARLKKLVLAHNQSCDSTEKLKAKLKYSNRLLVIAALMWSETNHILTEPIKVDAEFINACTNCYWLYEWFYGSNFNCLSAWEVTRCMHVEQLGALALKGQTPEAAETEELSSADVVRKFVSRFLANKQQRKSVWVNSEAPLYSTPRPSEGWGKTRMNHSHHQLRW